MKNFKKITAFLVAFAAVLPFSPSASAYEKSYNNDIVEPMYFNGIVKDQGETGDCLYYALTASAECYVKKYYGKSVSFDENALRQSVLNEEPGTESLSYGEVTARMAGKELTVDSGNAGGVYAVSQVYEIDNTGDFKNKVKKAVKEYGAVTVTFNVCVYGMKCATHYKPKPDYSYYCPKDDYGDNTHAVSVVGWDDDNAAWLCKNSYGYDYGYCGFFWLSYEQALNSAAALTVSLDGETPALQEDLNWDNYYITAVYVQIVSKENMKAYGSDQYGNVHDCTVALGYENNYYEITPPEKAFFAKDTLCYFNGDKLDYGFTDGNETGYIYDPKTGKIGIQSKDAGAYSIVRIDTPKYIFAGKDKETLPGYVKLTYDNGAVRWILKKDFEKNGIKAGNSSVFADGELPALEGSRKYAVLKFDESFVFDLPVCSDKEHTCKQAAGCTYIAVAVENLNPQINLTEMIKVSSSWFGLIIGILQNLVFNVSAR